MSYRIALNFEDGVTRFIDCRDSETVLDAAYRQRVNLPMDCSDGVCGTCKCRAEQGRYELGDDYIEDALTEDEAAGGLVLTCQMVPSSDCVVAVPMSSTACKTGTAQFEATLVRITPHQDAALEVEFEVAEGVDPPVFLPGQYVNIAVPGSEQTRSYSFSSAPGARRLSFLIKQVPDGLMTGYLTPEAVGQTLSLTGPLGSFYLREVKRPLLLLAGGTGLAPFLSMLDVLASQGSTQPVQLLYAVTRDQDLVLVEQLQAYAQRLPDFTFATIVADKDSMHERKGFVTHHLPAEALHGGEVDVYLCGPPPMVDAVRGHLGELGVTPASFHYEKFTPSTAGLKEAA